MFTNFTLSDLSLRARWTLFTTPVEHVIQLRDEQAGPLKGCVLCISQDGTIAVIVIDGLQLYVVLYTDLLEDTDFL